MRPWSDWVWSFLVTLVVVGVVLLAVLVVDAKADGSRVDRALAIAQVAWNTEICPTSTVTVYRADLPGNVIAEARWQDWGSPEASDPNEPAMGPRSGHPSTFFNCVIRFDKNEKWPWRRFCTTMMHEVGHLAGKPHTDNPYSVMVPIEQQYIPRVHKRCRQ